MADNGNNPTRRRFLRATGSAAAGAALAGCMGGGGGGGNGSGGGGGNSGGGNNTGGGQQTQQKVNADPSKTLQRVMTGTITTLDPIASTDTASGEIQMQLFDALMNYPNAKANVKPLLAKNYETSNGNKTYTFTLKNATFHNGKTVTAQDFVYSFERLAASDNSKRTTFILDTLGIKHKTDSEGNYVSGSMAIRAPDKKTFELTLSSPFHAANQLLAYGAFSAVPEGIVGDIEGYSGKMPYNRFANQNPVGAGPFKFKNWQSGTSAAVTRYNNYHGKKASVAGVHWQVLEKDSPRFSYAMQKNADMFTIPTSQFNPDKVSIQNTSKGGVSKSGTYGPARNGETLDFYRTGLVATRYIGFNMSKVPKPVRQAFAYVANQQQIVEQIAKNREQPAYYFTPSSIFPGGQSAYEKSAKQNYPYGYNKTQVEKARQVMEDAGYSQNNKFNVQLTIYQSGTYNQLAKLFQSQLRQAHITMSISQVPFATMLERGRSGKLQAYTLGWIADWPEPDNFLQLLYPPNTLTSQPAPLIYVNWKPQNGSAYKQAKQAYETVKNNQAPTKQAKQARQKAYLKHERANWEDMALLPLWNDNSDMFSYSWTDHPKYGVMDYSRMKYDDVKVGQRN
jgi:ABC-type transport system substrate-binding protein